MAQVRRAVMGCLMQVVEGQQRLLKLAEETAGMGLRPSEGLLEQAWSAARCEMLQWHAAVRCAGRWEEP